MQSLVTFRKKTHKSVTGFMISGFQFLILRNLKRFPRKTQQDPIQPFHQILLYYLIPLLTDCVESRVVYQIFDISSRKLGKNPRYRF